MLDGYGPAIDIACVRQSFLENLETFRICSRVFDVRDDGQGLRPGNRCPNCRGHPNRDPQASRRTTWSVIIEKKGPYGPFFISTKPTGAPHFKLLAPTL